MDTKTKVVIISVCMDETTQLFNTLTLMLQRTFDEAKVHTSINIQNINELQEKLIFYTNLNTIDVILVLANSLKDEISKAIDEVNDAEITIVHFFATVPTLLCSTDLTFLHHAYRKNTLIFAVIVPFGNESDIIQNVKIIKNSIVLAAYLLRNIHPNCNESDRPHKREDGTSCSKDQFPFLIEDEENDMSLSSNSPTANTFQMDKADISTPTSQITCSSMISIDEALTIITDVLTVNVNKILQIETVNIKDAFGRRLFEAATCRSNVPSFPVATKHGYAVTAEEVTKEMEETSVEEIGLITLDRNTTKWVNNGEFIPSGATAVVSVNNTATFFDEGQNEIQVTSHKIWTSLKYGQNIKFPGDDIKEGEIIVHPNICMGSMEIGLLTACGWKKVDVIKEISIGVLTIGDNLQENRGKLLPNYSYDSNRAILISLLKENGFNSLNFGISIVHLTVIIDNITAALETVDLLVITRRSKDKDSLKTILKNHFKATLHFENVNIKPGKSTTFASCNFNDKIKYILCLPGNPESVLVTAHLFLLPLLKLLHFNTDERSTVMAKITQELPLHSRPRYVWATLSWSKGEHFAEIIWRKKNNPISNKLSNIINANAFLILPAKTPEVDTLKVSSFVPAILIKFPIAYV